MSCKLYIKAGSIDFYLGSFPNREKAEGHYRLIRAKVEDEYGTDAKPVYVETGKGRSK